MQYRRFEPMKTVKILTIILFLVFSAQQAVSISPAELSKQLLDAYIAGDTLSFNKLADSTQCHLNSALGILIKGYISKRHEGDTTASAEIGGSLNSVIKGKYDISGYYRNLAADIQAGWKEKDFENYMRARQLKTGSFKVKDGRWKDSLLSAIDIFMSSQVLHEVVDCEYSMAGRFSSLIEYDSALAHYSLAEQYNDQVNDIDRKYDILISKSVAYSNIVGFAAESIKALEQALKIAGECGYREKLIYCYNQLGYTYYYMDDYESALKKFEAADSVCTISSTARQRIYPLLHLALCCQKMGYYKTADSLFEKTLELARQCEQKSYEAWASYYQADGRLYISDTTGIRNRLFEAERIFREQKDTFALAGVHYQLGRLERIAKKYTRSFELLKASLNFYKDSKDRFYPARELAYAFRDADNIDSALSYANMALDFIVSVRSDMPRSVLRRRYLSDKYDIIALLIEIYLSKNAAEKALDIAEEFRARSFVESLKEKEAGDLPEKYRKQVIRIEREISELLKNVRACSLEESDIERIPQSLVALQDSLNDLYLMSAAASPLLIENKSADHESLIMSADNKTADLYYFMHDTTLIVWFKDEERLAWEIVSNNYQDLDDKIGAVLTRLSARPSIADTLQSLIEDLDDLSYIIPGLVKNRLKDLECLRVYPSGILSYFPFEVIRVSGQYLGEIVPVEYYPSLTIRDIVSGREKARVAVNDIIFFGGTFEEKIGQEGSFGYIDFPGMFQFPGDLPGVNAEENSIREKTMGQFVSLKNRSDQEEFIKKSGLIETDILHFATHGIILTDYPDFSSLILPLGHNSQEDEILRLNEIASLNMNISLVVLSACQTGLGKYITGEGIYGLSNAFITAGANSLVVSLWPLDDKASALFMEFFYKALGDKMSTAEALFYARNKLINNTIFKHPYFWAALTATGNWKSE